MRVLVCGGTGLVGSAILGKLIEKGYTVLSCFEAMSVCFSINSFSCSSIYTCIVYKQSIVIPTDFKKHKVTVRTL